MNRHRQIRATILAYVRYKLTCENTRCSAATVHRRLMTLKRATARLDDLQRATYMRAVDQIDAAFRACV